MIEIVDNPIDTVAVLATVSSDLSGANVLFVGTTRRMTGDKETVQLSYECYNEMAFKQMERLRDEAKSKWPVQACSIVHRVGEVTIGEASIAVAVSSPHRKDAFDAASWLVDQLKKQVPIWKREHWKDGTEEWVHPEGALPGKSPSES